MPQTIYILKTRGEGKISDQIQVRDAQMRLLAVFRINHPQGALLKCGLNDYAEAIVNAAREALYGKLAKVELQSKP